jgi:sulfocyanin
MRGWTLGGLAGFALLCGAALPPTTIRSADPVDPAWLSFDAAAKTARFKLTAGLTGLNGALNFNGYRDGELTLVVPVGWTVVVSFENHDGMLPHSAQVVAEQTPIPASALDKAGIDRAYTNKAFEGLAPQAKDNMRFTAAPAGNYLFVCGVPGHALAGMWIRLRVSPDASEPSVVATPKP